MRVSVVGGSGLIGGQLVAALAAAGHEAVVVSRRAVSVPGSVATVRWDPAAGGPPTEMLAGCDAVVNLAGESLIGRWTSAKKARVRESRIGTTERIVEALAQGGPRILVNASAVGFYGDAGDTELTESSPAGKGFLAETCIAWEAAARAAEAHGVRIVCARTGLVVAKDGGALPVLSLLAKLFANGPLAGGRQWYPWVHIADVAAAIVWAIEHDVSGPVNVVGPTPVPQGEFARVLGKVLRRPSFVPTPGFAVRAAMGEAADIILTSQRVLPAALLAGGYTFAETDLTSALARETG